MNSSLRSLQENFPELEFHSEFLLAPLTTVKIGGPAEIFCEVKDREAFIALISFCKKQHIPLTVLGWGANTLIADRGIRGLVIKYITQQISIHDEVASKDVSTEVAARWADGDPAKDEYPQFDKIDYSEADEPVVEVEIEAGVPLPFAINYLLQHGVTGLQWFSRIPATIGGAIFNNIHGGTHFMSEYVTAVKVVNAAGDVETLNADQLEFDYDYSRFHHSNELIISVTFQLYKGDVEKAKQVVGTWAQQKKSQPQNSLGCVYQNISAEDQQKLGYPTPSVGYIIDQILGKKGYQIGDAQISEKHAAFIENKGSATAAEYLALIKTTLSEIKEKTGLKVKPEIFFKGFTKEELSFLE